jgi:hypothetical protein
MHGLCATTTTNGPNRMSTRDLSKVFSAAGLLSHLRNWFMHATVRGAAENVPIT